MSGAYHYNSYPWHDDDKVLMARLLAEGLSRADIAAQLPIRNGIRPTRNAVIGKMERWGISNGAGPKPANPSRRPRKKKIALAPVGQEPRPKAAGPSLPAIRPEPIPEPPEPILFAEARPEEITIEPASDGLRPGGMAVLALRWEECKWPIGDPRIPGFSFCCAPRVEGRPYCQHHIFESAAEPGTKVGWWRPKGRR